MAWRKSQLLKFAVNLPSSFLLAVTCGCTEKKPSFIDRGSPASSIGVAPEAPVITVPTMPTYTSNGTNVNISGTCENLALVNLTGGSADSQGCAGGTFNFLVNKNTDGSYPYTVTQTNTHGTSVADSVTWNRDTVAPAAPGRISPAANTHVSGDTTFSFIGSCEAGAAVVMSGDSTATTSCAGGGTFSQSIAKSSDGIYNFSFVQTDAANNSSATLAFQWTRDSSLPNTPTITAPAATPSYTNGGSLTIAGACTSGFTVTLGGDVTAGQVTAPVGSLTQTCTGGGAYSFSFSKGADATYNLTVKQTNLSSLDSGNAAQAWVRDTVAPSAPTITTPTSSPHYGTVSLTLSGACESAATVNLSGDDTQSVACVSSAYTFTIIKGSDAAYNFSVTQTDRALNTSGATAQQWIRDNAPPSTPTITAPAADPYYSNSGSFTISGACTTGLSVTLGGDVAAGEVTTPMGSLTRTCSGGAYSFTFAKGSDATYNLTIKQTSLSGVNSANAIRSWIRDTLVPSAPTITTPVSSPHTVGGNLTIAGACETFATVNLTGDDTQSVTCASSAYTFTVVKVSDATYNFAIMQSDRALNSSGANSQQWVRISTPPAAPVITLPASSPHTSNGGSVTVSGTCIAGNTVNLGGASTSSMTCTGGGTFSFSPTKSSDGSYTFSVTQTDVGGTSSAVYSTWDRDSTAPVAIVFTSPAQNPFTSGDTIFLISGSCEANSTISMTGSSSATTSCSAVGTFSQSVTKSSDAVYTFNFIQTDAANNNSVSTSFTWIRDTTIPPTPTITAPTTNPKYSNTTAMTIAGGCTSGDTITLAGDIVAGDVTTPAGSLTFTCASSAYSFTFNKSIDGTYAFSITATNAALINSAPASQTWVRDTITPIAPIVISPSVSPWNGSGNLTISGTCETDATVNLIGDSIQSIVCAANAYSFDIVKASDATYNFTLTQSDRAANTSGSVAQQWVRNSALPPTPTILSPSSSPFRSTSNTLVLSGACSSGLLVTLSGGVTAGQVTSPAGSLTQTCTSSGYSYTIIKGVEGTYSLSVKQTSGGGDSGTVTTQWIYDGSPPTTNIGTAPSDPNISIISQFTFTVDDALATSECKIDAGSYSPCTSPVTYSSLSNASHTFNVRSTDQAGNVEALPDAHTWVQSAGRTVALYHFDTGTGHTSDSGSYSGANNLTNSGSTSTTGKFFEGASLVAASSQYLTLPHTSSVAVMTSYMTVDLWVRMTSLPPANGTKMIFASKMGATGQMGWEFGIKRQGANYQLYFLGSLNGTASTEVKSANLTGAEQTALTGGFNHLAVTWDKGTVKIFLAGASKISGVIGSAGTSTLFNNSSTAFRVGTIAAGGSYLNGVVDEIRLSQTVRWTTGFTVPASAFTAD